MKRLLFLLTCAVLSAQSFRFAEHSLAGGLRGGYQVVPIDLNKDGRPDLLALASGMDELVWFENPRWERRVMARGLKRMINAAPYDTDRDGVPEMAVASGFENEASRSTGIVTLLKSGADPRTEWSVREIDRLTTSHRLRWADIDGSGRKVLVNAALTGARADAPDYRDHVPLVFYRPGEWARHMAGAENEGVMHGIFITDWDRKGREAILTASFSGIHLYRFGRDQKWTREAIARGDPAAWPKSGSSDVAVGRLGAERFLASIEPWHGHQVVVYRGKKWDRAVIEEGLPDSHSIGIADFDGDRRDEILVAQRGRPGRVVIYALAGTVWKKTVLDEGITAASCAPVDLNGDGRVDVTCIGSTTQDLKWYENQGPVSKGFR